MNYEIVGECSPTNVATFECGNICGRLVGEEKLVAGIYVGQMPADWL